MPARGAAAVVLMMLASPAYAQSRPEPQFDPSKLPVSFERIHRELKQSTVTEERDGLNLRYSVKVFGQAPRLELFTPGEDLSVGPVPGSAPTHREMVDQVTPREYRAPAADFNALLRWLAERAKK